MLNALAILLILPLTLWAATDSYPCPGDLSGTLIDQIKMDLATGSLQDAQTGKWRVAIKGKALNNTPNQNQLASLKPTSLNATLISHQQSPHWLCYYKSQGTLAAIAYQPWHPLISNIHTK